ncbi:MAG TPA: AarF/UbiB family protein [Polyangia bacterium]|nr:AarF/UbiB family protein [Polyangia bacterium]
MVAQHRKLDLVPGDVAAAPPRPRPRRPPRLRLFKAYYVTMLVVGSYLSLQLQARFRSPAAIARLARRKHLRNARRIERAVAELRGLFIKMGQLFSIMTNFLPAEFRSQLERLQDHVPPRSYEDVEARFQEEFGGRTPREVFVEFDEKPVASASIGQVHMARTRDGEKVAVKVQYPDIEEIVRIDLLALKRIFGIISYFLPYQGLDATYRELRAMVLQELDFRQEADSIERIAANFPDREDVGFPKVLRELSTARILTTSWIDGVKVSDRQRLQALGIDRRQLARTVVAAYCQQIFSDGIYHADPHPGNLLVQAGGKVVFIDFGAVAEVAPEMRRGIVALIQAGLARDTPRVIQAMKDMGFIARGADPRIFDQVVDFLYQKFQEDIQLDSFSLRDARFDPEQALERIADLRRMNVSLRDVAEHFHVPKEWIMLERTVLLLLGLCTELDPELNPMEVIRPYLEEFVLGKDMDRSDFLVSTGKELLLSAAALPGEVKKFIGRALSGDVEVRLRGLDEHARVLYALGHQMIYAGLGVAGVTFWMLLGDRGRLLEAHWAGWGALGSFGLLGISFFTNRGGRGRGRR